VIAAEDVFTKYPCLAVTVKLLVTTACHAAPPATVAKDKLPEPSVYNTWFAVPVAVGNVNVYGVSPEIVAGAFNPT